MPFGGLLTVGLISAGTSLFGAYKQSKAANKAADQQVAATDKGLALQRDIYGQQVAGMQPYAQFGQQALGSLGSLMGFPAMPAGSAAPLGPITGSQEPMNMSDPRVQHLASGGSLVDPEAGTIGAATRSGYRSPASGVVAGQQHAPPTGGSFGGPSALARVASPDGEVREVPMAMVAQLEQLGGRRVG